MEKELVKINRSHVQALLREASGKRIVVLGDVMVDHSIQGRIMPTHEFPGTKFLFQSEEFRLGGAANVAHNIARLGGQALLVSVTGDDGAAKTLRSLLAGKNGDLSIEPFLVIDNSRPTTVKTRHFADNSRVETIPRVDRESLEFISGLTEERLKRQLLSALASGEGVVVCDYQKGVVTEGEMGVFFTAVRAANGVPIYVDPKYRPVEVYRGASVITPNVKEAAALIGRDLRTEEEILAAGPELLGATGAEAVLLTRSEDGMTLFEHSRDAVSIPTVAQKVVDVVGAGDTVIATLALMRAAGASYLQAAQIANVAAGIVVGKVDTAAVSAEDLLAEFKD